VRPDDHSFIGQQIEKPYEIHFVSFDKDQDFENFKNDREREKFLHLKQQSISSAVMILGTRL
jgi:hypothetical protein